MADNILRTKSFYFAGQIVELYKHMILERKEFVLSKQILRSGTSIGANVEEAIGGQSEADFMSKLSIAYKEARETSYGSNFCRKLNILNLLKQENTWNCVMNCKESLAQASKPLKPKRRNNPNSRILYSPFYFQTPVSRLQFPDSSFQIPVSRFQFPDYSTS
jgi:four helix bundle protein